MKWTRIQLHVKRVSPRACGTDPSSELAILERFLELDGEKLCEDGKAKPDLPCFFSSFQRQSSAAISLDNEAKCCRAVRQKRGRSLTNNPPQTPLLPPSFDFKTRKHQHLGLSASPVRSLDGVSLPDDDDSAGTFEECPK